MQVESESISVVIPAYNRRQQVQRAIASALAQSLPPHEILVVDDASSDDTPAAVAALADPRLRLLRHDRNRGAGAARNTGVAAATGKWIAFLDSDDEWKPPKLERQLAQLGSAPKNVAANVTGYVIDDQRNGQTRRLWPTERQTKLGALVWGCALGPGSTMMVSRRAFVEIGPFDEELRRLEDWDWLMRYLRRYALGIVPETLALVHKSGDPSAAHVVSSVARLREKHRADWYAHSWLGGRKFDATLLIEAAAAAYYERDKRRATALVLRALLTYPLRGADFFATVARRGCGAALRS